MTLIIYVFLELCLVVSKNHFLSLLINNLLFDIFNNPSNINFSFYQSEILLSDLLTHLSCPTCRVIPSSVSYDTKTMPVY